MHVRPDQMGQQKGLYVLSQMGPGLYQIKRSICVLAQMGVDVCQTKRASMNVRTDGT